MIRTYLLIILLKFLFLVALEPVQAESNLETWCKDQGLN